MSRIAFAVSPMRWVRRDHSGRLKTMATRPLRGIEWVRSACLLANFGEQLGYAFEDAVLVFVDGNPSQSEARWVLQAFVDVHIAQSRNEHAFFIDGHIGFVSEQESGQEHRENALLHAKRRLAPTLIDRINANAGAGVGEKLLCGFP